MPDAVSRFHWIGYHRGKIDRFQRFRRLPAHAGDRLNATNPTIFLGDCLQPFFYTCASCAVSESSWVSSRSISPRQSSFVSHSASSLRRELIWSRPEYQDFEPRGIFTPRLANSERIAFFTRPMRWSSGFPSKRKLSPPES